MREKSRNGKVVRSGMNQYKSVLTRFHLHPQLHVIWLVHRLESVSIPKYTAIGMVFKMFPQLVLPTLLYAFKQLVDGPLASIWTFSSTILRTSEMTSVDDDSSWTWPVLDVHIEDDDYDYDDDDEVVVEVVEILIDDDDDDLEAVSEEFTDADDGWAEEMELDSLEDEEEILSREHHPEQKNSSLVTLEVHLDGDEAVASPEMYIGELTPQLRKGRIVKNKYLVKLPKDASKLLKDETFLQELTNMEGIHIPSSCDMVYIEAESREMADAVYHQMTCAFSKTFGRKMRLLQDIMKAHSSLPQGRLCRVTYKCSQVQKPMYCFVLKEQQQGQAIKVLSQLHKKRYLQKNFSVSCEMHGSLVTMSGREEGIEAAYDYIGEYLSAECRTHMEG